MKWIFKFLLLTIFCIKIKSVEVFCEFEEFKEYNFEYGCKVQHFKITSKDDRNISKAVGHHLDGKIDFSVKIFSSYQKIVQYFPRNLKNVFKNLKILSIQSGNMKEISSNDLKSFGDSLKILNFFGNSIEVIESGIFNFNSNIEKIDLGGNKIKHVDDESFNGLNKLIELKFERNPCYSGYALKPEDIFKLIKFIKSFCKNENFEVRREIKSLRNDLENVKKNMEVCQCLGGEKM